MSGARRDPAARFQPRVRAALMIGGALLACLVLASNVLAHRAGGMGPAQRQVLVLGVLGIVAGLIPAVSRMMAAVLARAATRQPPALEPVTVARRWQLAGIVALALAFRLVMAGVYWPSNQMVMGMALWDAEMARNLLQGRGWVLNWDHVMTMDRAVVERQAMVDPQDFPADDTRPGALAPLADFPHTAGYSLWLASSFALGRAQRFVYSQWMQAGLDALACLCIFGIGRRLWSGLAGVLGALAYAVSPAHAYLVIQTVAAATDSFWAILIAYGAVRAWDAHQRGESRVPGLMCIVAGSAVGAAMNSAGFVLPIVLAAWTAIVGIAAKPARRLVPYFLAAQVAVVALLLPWALRNKQVYGQLAFTRQTVWQFMWETLGSVPNPWGLAIGDNDIAYWNWVRTNCPAPCTPAARETFTRDYLFREVFRSPQFPGHMIRLVAMQLPGLIYVSRLPADKPLIAHTPIESTLAVALRALNLAALLIWPAALAGLVILTLQRSTAAGVWIGLAPTIFIIAFSLVFYIEHRKTTPAFGYLLALSGVAAAAFVEQDAAHH
ncbi:MAG: hypothetical protein HY048_16165 [Acidobacteria bacterium]|nr:hypothetical protein [Acidobacteriota bacterium]